jgi:hypothetical protein
VGAVAAKIMAVPIAILDAVLIEAKLPQLQSASDPLRTSNRRGVEHYLQPRFISSEEL